VTETTPFRRNRRPLRRSGFSLIETVLSVLLVGGLFVAAINTAGAAAAARRNTTNRAEGLLLAQDMLAEIVQQAYEEPSGSVVVLGIDVTSLLGLDSGELGANSSRAAFDDVDDYNGWSGTPQTKQGTAIAWASAYTVSVEVVPVELNKPRKTSTLETGVKRVIVTVKRGGREVARLTAYRSKNWGGRVDN
jgi:type II secretory pathway pseudopilin PulG